ncbi:hypothetical protein I2484_20995, partial [Sporosarcina sp. E16_8]|nr:hypothetical protein [Sporosarcina sp. E16_8]
EPIYKYRGTVTKPASDNRVYRYQGNVTKPATDTRTYEDRFQYEISLDYERVVPVQKWTKGNQIVEFFKNAGVELNGTTFTVSENDTYTVYAEDTAGNESIETINISNIDKKPITPILSASPITPTNENVTVEIKYSDNSVVKKYRIDSGVWTDYTVPISIIKNGTVEAKGQNSEGEWSEIGSISLNNIDKTAPDISLSASPTTLTATDVTITADIRDLDNELFKTPESTSTIQTHTFSIPGLKMLNGAKANTGNAEIVNVDGEKVTVKVSGGNPSRKVETGGSYTPEDTKYVEGQTSSSYNSGGYVGNLLQYVYSGSYTPSHSIEVTGQSSSYYNSGGYSGTLSQYYYGPGPSSLRLISSNHGYGQDHSGMSGNGQYFYECNPSNGNPQGGWFCKLYEVIPGEPIYKYRGTVTKPASDNRVYRYQGNVTKPATDTRTYEDRFQ